MTREEVEKLIVATNRGMWEGTSVITLCRSWLEQADELLQKDATIAALREALKPFATVEIHPNYIDLEVLSGRCKNFNLTIGDLRHAKAVYNKTGDQ